jgi:predicted acyl esterase
VEHEYSCLIYVCTCDNAELERLKAENEKLKAKADWTLFDKQVKTLQAENARLMEALEFTLKAAEYVYQPDKPVHKGLDPTFYHTLTYEGDMELIEKTKKAREALKGGE